MWCKVHYIRAGSVRIFQIRFDSVSFQSQVPGSVFWFWFLHIIAMKAHAAGKTSKVFEAAEAFTPSTSSMHNQQLLLMWINGRDAMFDSKIWIIQTPDSNSRLWLFEKIQIMNGD